MTDSPDAVADSSDDGASSADRSPESDAFWEEVRVDPVKVALPGMVGYTLRAYRPAGELTLSAPTAGEGPDEDLFAERERARAAEEAARAAQDEELERAAAEGEDPARADEADRARPGRRATAADGDDADGDRADRDDDEPDPEDFLDEEEQPAGPSPDEDMPVFLSQDGRLLLFDTAESLVSFVTSKAEHDLTQLDSWSTVAERITPEDVVARADDTYELDLVVENLRGGHDAWDLPLLISAGEFARDVGWALQLTPVMTALSPGSPLDDLDEALRATAAGGFGGFFARRRLRRIGAQQASLGWRTVIGKITSVVDWRDTA